MYRMLLAGTVGATFTIGGMHQSMERSLLSHVQAKQTESELLSYNLYTVIQEHMHKVKQAEAARALAVSGSLCDFHFQKYTITQDQIAGALPSEVAKLIAVLRDPARFMQQGLQELPVGVLFKGPVGTGKTMLAKIIASQTGRLMAHEYSSSFITSLQGSGVERIGNLFNEAHKLKAPVILFLDEIDGLANDELKGSEGEAKRAVHELHRQLDMAGPLIFVIMATNKYDAIPASIKDRFAHHTIEVGLPDFSYRLMLLKNFCARAQIKAADEFLAQLAMEMEGVSARVLENMVTNALICAGQRASDASVGLHDFYIAAYTSQNVKLPNSTRRLELIKHYLLGKRLAQDIDDAFLAVCVQETQGWDAQKLEKWSALTQGIALAQNSSEIERVHALIAFSLFDTQKIPHKIRRKLLFSYLILQAGESIPEPLDMLLEESEGVSTRTLQHIVELALDIKIRRKHTVLHIEPLIIACTLLVQRSLTYDKRLLILRHFLEEEDGCCSVEITKDFLADLVKNIPNVLVEQMKSLVEKAREAAHSRGSRLLAPEDFYVAVCLCQKTMPLYKAEYRIALVNYYLKQYRENDFSPATFQELIALFQGANGQEIETSIKEAENWALKRNSQKMQHIDVLFSLYENTFARIQERTSIREAIISFLLEKKGTISHSCLQKVVRATRGFTFDRITRMFDYIKEAASGDEWTDADLSVGLFLELEHDEKEVSLTKGKYTIRDRIPYGDTTFLPDKAQRKALLVYYLKRKYHKVSDAFKNYFIENTQGASRYGILALVELARATACVAGAKESEVLIDEHHMIKATQEIYPFVGFWPWQIQSVGRIRQDFHEGFNVPV